MQLTKHTDYAFRVLVYLASMKQDKTTIQGITNYFNISKTHLMKVVNTLVKKGWGSSTRGKNGGVSASDINLKDVLTHMEHNLDPLTVIPPPAHLSLFVYSNLF